MIIDEHASRAWSERSHKCSTGNPLMKAFCRFFVFAFTVSLIAGCGGAPADQPDVGSVSGKITVDGKPGAGLQVSFQPESGRPSMGTTDETGAYELQYTGSVKGAKVGKGVVRISTVAASEESYGAEGGQGSEGDSEEHTDVIPPKYNSEAADNPEMQIEVKPGSNTFDFTVTTGS